MGAKVFRLRWLGVIPVNCQSSRLEPRGTDDEFLQARLGSCLETKAVRSTSHIVAPGLTHRCSFYRVAASTHKQVLQELRAWQLDVDLGGGHSLSPSVA